MVPKEHIENIRERYEQSDKEYALASVVGSIEGIEMNFPRSHGSFLMEFIQNTDDAKSEKMKVEIAENEIRILNAGELFSKLDVDGLCRIGNSKKKTTGDYIGYFGIGFKSIFLVSEHIEIYSGDYRFKFDKKEFSEENMPWQVIPLWLEQPTTGRGDDYTTLFKVAVKDPKLTLELREETEPIKPSTDRLLHNRLLLFLRKLRQMEISDTTKGTTRKIIKTPRLKAYSHEIFSIEEHINESPSCHEKWLVFRSEFNVEDKVRQDEVTKMRKKDKIDKREAVVAFRLNDSDSLMKEEKGTAYFGVHSYMPLKDVETGFNFLIQADFFTNTSRSALAADCLWNEWLAKSIYQAIETCAIPAFKADEQWKFNFIDVLYTRWGGNNLFEKYVARPIRDYAETRECYVAEDGSFIPLKSVMTIDPKVRDLMNDQDLKELYPDKNPLHPECVVPGDLIWHVQEGPHYSLNRGINTEMEKLLDIKAKQKDINFFRQFYTKLITEYSEEDIRRNKFAQYQKMVLTDAWELIVPDKAKINLSGIKVSEYLKEEIKIVHSELMEPDLIKLFKALGVPELKESCIEEIELLKRLLSPDPNNSAKPWHEMTESERLRAIKLLKNEWMKNQRNPIQPLTLKTKSGKWISPAEIIFSKEYNPDHSLEEVAGKGIYDLPAEFLSADFIEGESDIREWRRFFEDLGVDEKIRNKDSVRDIVQRIGIVMALSCEKDKGRQATELPRSKEKGGYDIISLIETDDEDGIGVIESEKRLIEVKSSKNPFPDIPLSLNQSKTLKQEVEFYVYVVRNALRQPQLYITPGNRLKDLAGKITIPYKEWSKNAIEDEYSL